MQSPHGFIVTPVSGKRYSNTRKFGGMEMIVSVSEEDHKYSNRFGFVKELPLRYTGPIKKGDLLLVHHNVFKFFNDIRGKRQSGKSWLADNDFLVEPDQYFMFKNLDGWHTVDNYVFVKPIKGLDSFIYKEEEPLIGIIKYSNLYLISKGVNVGDKICFAPDSEYEFEIDGEKLFRIFEHRIVAKL